MLEFINTFTSDYLLEVIGTLKYRILHQTHMRLLEPFVILCGGHGRKCKIPVNDTRSFYQAGNVPVWIFVADIARLSDLIRSLAVPVELFHDTEP